MVGVAVGLVVAAATTWLVTRVGPRLGYLDAPDDSALKAHAVPAVPLGGVAVCAGAGVGLWIEGALTWPLVVAGGMLVVLGLIDDRIGLAPMLRLAATVGAGAVLAAGFTDWGPRIFVVVLVVVAVNAVNLFDGLDGLAGSSAVMTALGAAGLAWVRGTDPVPALVVAACVTGFLVFNWHPARAFLGDNGAYLVAALLVWSIASAGPGPASLVTGTGLLGVFLIDLAVTVLRRLRGGAPLFAGDRSHLYDVMHQRGVAVPRVAVAFAVVQLALVTLVLLVAQTLSGWGAAAATVGLGALVVGVLVAATPAASS